MSEWGAFRNDGDSDMVALYDRAIKAVEYFNADNQRRAEMNNSVFGYSFSLIKDGRLLDEDGAYRGNIIERSLYYLDNGVYEGLVLSYNDAYHDHRGQGGSGRVLMDRIKFVSISDGFLSITGMDGREEQTYRYRIQNHAGKILQSKPDIPSQKSLDTDWATKRRVQGSLDRWFA